MPLYALEYVSHRRDWQRYGHTTYNTREQAERACSMENMGSDCFTFRVVEVRHDHTPTTGRTR